MRKVIGYACMLLYLYGCVDAEIKGRDSEDRYSIELTTESQDLIITAVPGENLKFRIKVTGPSALSSMTFYADSTQIDISGIQKKRPPYSIDLTSFTIDKNSNEKTIFCKVVAVTMDGMYINSNVLAIRVLDTEPPIIVKFEKDQQPLDSIISDSPFSIIVEAQEMNTEIAKVELADLNNVVSQKYSESFRGKYFNKRFSFVAPRLNCGIVEMVLRICDNSVQQNCVEKSLLLKVNGHPFDENAPVLTYLSPQPNSRATIGDMLYIKIGAEDDCSLVNNIYYYTSFDSQVKKVEIVNKKRIVEEDIAMPIPTTLNDGEEFSVFAWADDTNDPPRGSNDNAVELKLVATGINLPKVVINNPTDNTSVSAGDNITINGVASSNRYQIKEIDLRLTGSYREIRRAIINPPQETAMFSFNFTIPSNLKSGDQIIIYVDAKDNSSSESVGTAGPVRLNIIAQRPMVQIIYPSNNDIFYPLGTINTTVFAQSSTSSIKSIFYHIEGIEGVTVDETYTPSSPQKSVSKTFVYKLSEDVMEGDLVISAEAVDSNGIQGSAQPVMVKIVDNVKPVVSITSPPYNSQVEPGSTFDLTVKVEDKNSLVYEVYAKVVSPYNDSKKLVINKKSDEVNFVFTVPDTLVSNQVIIIQVYASDDSSLANQSEVVQWRLRVR